MPRVYDTLEWDLARRSALDRDGHTCAIGRLTGTPCHHLVDVHHVVPVDDGGDPYGLANLICVCHEHHPQLEAFRRHMLRMPSWRCPHRHTTPEGRRQCEARRRARLAA